MFLILTFIVLVVFLILFILSYLKLRILPNPDTLPPDPNLVACSEDDILEAWIRGYPNRETCPPFTNNYVIGNDFNMYEKFFMVDVQTQCCWYSNETAQREIFANPWICNGYTSTVPTPNELNLRPYYYDGRQTLYINPSCDDDPNCIALIRAGLDNQGSGVYKVSKFRTESTDTYPPGSEIPPPDSSADIARDLNLYVSPSCLILNRMTYKGETVVERTAQGYVWYDDSSTRPDIVQTIFDIFQQDRFYPIAGANVILSQYAAEYL